MLRESQDYVSGQQICERFQVSRTAVWKVIKQLKEEGYEVEAVRNRGYRLSSLPDILSREEIVSQIDTVWAGQNVYYFTETDSTNIQAKRMGDQGAPHGTLAAAGQQQTFTISNDGVKADNVTNIIPCSISSAYGYNNYQPTPAEGDEKTRIMEKIQERSSWIG